MKTTYLVKKDPKQPSDSNNWIVMNGKEFIAFKQTEEGKQRSNNFIRLCTEYDEECIVMECDLENLIKWKSELNRSAYVEKVKREKGYTVLSYHQFESGEEDVDGESVLVDMEESLEETVIEKIEIEKLLKLVGRLCEEDQKLIYSFYLTDEPMLETVYAKENGISRQVVHFRKERAIERLKKLYFS